ncbi:MAG: SUMF1/EgtB/PvdO family nonheme iron enzyme [Thermoanaerobaculaceae bacterium]|nr:SUMF1/EgtB/PvdO family nonheme iron enzyme [Thermoanaerobaculaceae bacterium]
MSIGWSGRVLGAVAAGIGVLLLTPMAAAQTVVAVAGNQITVSVGSRDGVREGMTGKVTSTESIGGKLTTLEVAYFRVTRADATTAQAVLTEVGPGARITTGMGVVFNQPLTRPTAGPPPTERPRPTPTPRIPSDPAELDRLATAAYQAGRWGEAIELYRALLVKVPGEPLATRRLGEATAKLEAERAAAEDASRRAAENARRREEVQRKLANADYLLGKGDQMLAAGEWELAAQYYGQVADVDPSYQDAGLKRLLARGRLAVASRDTTAAQDIARQLDGLSIPYALADQARALRAAMAALAPAAGEKRRFGPAGTERAYIPAGSFTMGCVSADSQCGSDEKPSHRVTISRGFWMDVSEVTVGSYRTFTQATGRSAPPSPSFAQGDAHPVVNVSWEDASAFCGWAGGRLPSEAEWEYAARGGREGMIYPWGDRLSHEEANYGKDSCCGGLAQGRDQWEHTSPVGSFAANGFGLVDMAGNVWEWVGDWYDGSYYGSSPGTDPTGPASGTHRVLRGGSWFSYPDKLRVSCRDLHDPSYLLNYICFGWAGDEGGGRVP